MFKYYTDDDEKLSILLGSYIFIKRVPNPTAKHLVHLPTAKLYLHHCTYD